MMCEGEMSSFYVENVIYRNSGTMKSLIHFFTFTQHYILIIEMMIGYEN